MDIKTLIGKYIRFTKEIKPQETVFDTDMMARVVGISPFTCEVQMKSAL